MHAPRQCGVRLAVLCFGPLDRARVCGASGRVTHEPQLPSIGSSAVVVNGKFISNVHNRVGSCQISQQSMNNQTVPPAGAIRLRRPDADDRSSHFGSRSSSVGVAVGYVSTISKDVGISTTQACVSLGRLSGGSDSSLVWRGRAVAVRGLGSGVWRCTRGPSTNGRSILSTERLDLSRKCL